MGRVVTLLGERKSSVECSRVNCFWMKSLILYHKVDLNVTWWTSLQWHCIWETDCSLLLGTVASPECTIHLFIWAADLCFCLCTCFGLDLVSLWNMTVFHKNKGVIYLKKHFRLMFLHSFLVFARVRIMYRPIRWLHCWTTLLPNPLRGPQALHAFWTLWRWKHVRTEPNCPCRNKAFVWFRRSRGLG